MDEFTPTQIETLYQVIAARRDMRHFRSDPLDEALMERLLRAAHCAPSVGYMQPWRFIREEASDIGVKNPVHAGGADPPDQPMHVEMKPCYGPLNSLGSS